MSYRNIFFCYIQIMDVQQKNIEDNDNSQLKIKPKIESTSHVDKLKLPLPKNNQQNLFRMTDSRVTKLSDQNASHTVSMVSTPSSSLNGFTCKQEKNHAPIDTRLAKTPLFRNFAFNSSKQQNINLTPSLHLTRNPSTNQSRKFKIFNQPLQINFQLPPLSQYYTKNRYQNDMNVSLGPSEVIATKQPNNLNNLNNSILDFRYSQRGKNRPSLKAAQLKYGNINSSVNGLNMSTLVSSKNLQASNTQINKQYKDQIKEQEENKEEDKIGRKYSETAENNFGKYFKQFGKKNNIIYMVMSFIFAVLFMILGRLLL